MPLLWGESVFGGIVTPPQIAVYNENGRTANFLVQDKKTTVPAEMEGIAVRVIINKHTHNAWEEIFELT